MRSTQGTEVFEVRSWARKGEANELPLDPLTAVIADVRAGKPILLLDDSHREDEADVVVAAELVTSEHICFMLNEAKGLICLSLTRERLAALALAPQVVHNTAPFGTNFTVSIDLRGLGEHGVTAFGRAKTIRAAMDERTTARDFVSPGYVFPLGAVEGGVLKRRGQTEGSVDLVRLAGLRPGAVICEVMGSDGTMLRAERLLEYRRRHGLRMTSVEELVRYRLRYEANLRRVAEGEVADVRRAMMFERRSSGEVIGQRGGDPSLRVVVYLDDVDGLEHLVLVKGRPKNGCLVRIHSECLTGDVFGSKRCDCGVQLEKALRAIEDQGEGILIYLHQEGRGIGLGNKLRAYCLQDEGLDTVEANEQLGFAPDLRDYRAAAEILVDMGVSEIRLMTNNPAKVASLERFGVRVQKRIPLGPVIDVYNAAYIKAKRDRLGHLYPPFEV